MAVKSAIMTTASRVKKANGKLSGDYLAQGAGNVRPDRMFNPGVIFDAGDRDWFAFLEGEGVKTDTGVNPIQPKRLQRPVDCDRQAGWFTDGDEKGHCSRPGTYQTDISVPGVTATVTPSILNFSSAGQTKTVEITFTRNAAPLSKAVLGSVKFAGAGTVARLPIAVRQRPPMRRASRPARGERVPDLTLPGRLRRPDHRARWRPLVGTRSLGALFRLTVLR